MQPFARVKTNMQSKYRRGAMLSYGVIGLGIMGMMVGFNYLAVLYSRVLHRKRGEIVIALSIVAILAGIVGALSAQPKGGMAAFSSVIMLGVIAILLDERWHPAPTEPSQPTRRTPDKKT